MESINLLDSPNHLHIILDSLTEADEEANRKSEEEVQRKAEEESKQKAEEVEDRKAEEVIVETL
jgi:membrane protein involved in colicin uptake